MDVKNIAQYFDHTALKPETTLSDIERLCKEATTHNFAAVCVNPFWLPQCRDFLRYSKVKLCTVVGFPLGASGSAITVAETDWAIKNGAQEIDCVINIGALKSKLFKIVQQELSDIVAHTRGHALVKVIVESGILTPEQLLEAIELVNESGAEYIKTSTGFVSVGATPEAVKTMKEKGRPGLKIKASGGIRTLADAKTYIDLGVARIGASQSVQILEDSKKA